MYNELFRRRPSKSGGVPDVGALSKNVNRNIEELISNSETTISNQADKGERHKQNGIKGFNTRRVKFYDGQRAYNVEFSIANMKNGEKIAYAKKFFGYDAALTKKIQTAEAASSQSRVNQQSESADTMPQTGESVNRKFSMDMGLCDYFRYLRYFVQPIDDYAAGKFSKDVPLCWVRRRISSRRLA